MHLRALGATLGCLIAFLSVASAEDIHVHIEGSTTSTWTSKKNAVGDAYVKLGDLNGNPQGGTFTPEAVLRAAPSQQALGHYGWTTAWTPFAFIADQTAKTFTLDIGQGASMMHLVVPLGDDTSYNGFTFSVFNDRGFGGTPGTIYMEIDKVDNQPFVFHLAASNPQVVGETEWVALYKDGTGISLIVEGRIKMPPGSDWHKAVGIAAALITPVPEPGNISLLLAAAGVLAIGRPQRKQR